MHFNLVGFIVFQPFFKGFSPSLTMFFLWALERELIFQFRGWIGLEIRLLVTFLIVCYKVLFL